MATNKQEWLGPLTESFRILWRWLSASLEALRPVAARAFARIRSTLSGTATRLRRSRAESDQPETERGPPTEEAPAAVANASQKDWLRSALRVDAWPPALV